MRRLGLLLVLVLAIAGCVTAPDITYAVELCDPAYGFCEPCNGSCPCGIIRQMCCTSGGCRSLSEEEEATGANCDGGVVGTCHNLVVSDEFPSPGVCFDGHSWE